MAPLRPNDLYPTQDAAILVHPATQALEDAMTTDSLRRHSGYPFANQYDGWDRMEPDGIGIFFMAHLVQWCQRSFWQTESTGRNKLSRQKAPS